MFDFIKRIEKQEQHCIDSLKICVYFLITSLIIICNALILKKHLILLVENQVLYIFSVVAQVVGTFIGVSIAGYTLLDSRNNSIDDIDDDGIKELQKSVARDQFIWLIRIITYGLIDIVLCLFSISLYDKKPSWLFDIISGEALVILLLFFIILIKFTLFLSPKAISKQSDSIKNSMDKRYQKKTAQIITFDEYITKFNKLEKVLYDLVNIYDKKGDYMVGATIPRHPKGFLNSCTTLKEMRLLNNATCIILDDIRQYRNALVHGTEENKDVNEEIYNKLIMILKLLEALRDYAFENNTIIFESRQYRDLVKYALDNVLSDEEKKYFADIKMIVKNAKNREISNNQLRIIKYWINSGLLNEFYLGGKLTKNEYHSILTMGNRK
ncbi:hypothetical protein [Butyrivibrio sp. LB2008]|uniref:hypothetical protein n=1 Tax=Butyrivibrio sp. LB2008 TaxID=1408305 RepID=UPI00047A66A3|nr:hypothetical protein [Butyrivibrio sp. LB2008]